MLIQHREKALRLITQHDHGLLSGELAMGWRGVSGSEELSEELVLATALHDLAWRGLDADPAWNPASGAPCDFLDFPSEEKYEAAVEGIDRVAELNPYAAVLVSLHYRTLGSSRRPEDFETAEERRRDELLAELGEDAPDPARIRRDLEFLRLFDNLSLLLCLTPPGAAPESRPTWLTPDLVQVPGGGPCLSIAWRAESEEVSGILDIAPFPFGNDPLDLDVAYRDLPEGPFQSGAHLLGVWHAAREETFRIRLAKGR